MIYKISTDIKNINNINNKIYYLTQDANTIIFYTLSLEYDFEYVILFNIRTFLTKLLITNLGIIIGIFFFIIYLYLNHNFVSIITITNSDYKEEIREEFNSYIDNNIIYNTLNTDLDTINKIFKQKYYFLEYIDITKIGSTINITVRDVNDFSLDNIISEESRYSNSEGIVKYIDVQQGKVLVSYNDYINVGELLISNDLNYTTITDEDGKATQDTSKEQNLTSTEGYILAETIKERLIKVPKKQSISYYDINQTCKYQFTIFSESLSFSSIEEDNTTLLTSSLFSFNTILNIDKLCYYKEVKSDIDISVLEANDIALNNLYALYTYSYIHPNERIQSILLEDTYEDEEYYYYNYVVKAIENVTR